MRKGIYKPGSPPRKGSSTRKGSSKGVVAEALAKIRKHQAPRRVAPKLHAEHAVPANRLAGATVQPGKSSTPRRDTIDPRRTGIWRGDLPPGHPERK